MTTGRILIVEDIPDTLAGTIAELAGAGVTIDCVTNVKDAFDRLREKKYDVVLLDWRLPLRPTGEVSNDAGLAVLKQSRSTAAGVNRDIPIIVLTAQFSIVDSSLLKQYPNCRYVISKLKMDDITARTTEILSVNASSSETATVDETEDFRER